MRLDITSSTTRDEILFVLEAIEADFEDLRQDRDRRYDALTTEEWLDDGYSKVDALIDYEYRFNKLMVQCSFYSHALEVIEL
jgi:hypothetical protein